MADANDGGFLRGTKTAGLYGPLVVQGPGGASLSGLTDAELRATPVPVEETPPARTYAAPVRQAASATNVTLMAANAARRGLTIQNSSGGAILYVKFGATATTTDYTFELAAGQYYEMPGHMRYTGRVDGIWASASGGSNTTEIT